MTTTASLEEALAERDETVMDLQMTLAAVSAEYSSQSAAASRASTNAIQSLEEQIRRLHHEVQFLSSSKNRQQQQQQHGSNLATAATGSNNSNVSSVPLPQLNRPNRLETPSVWTPANSNNGLQPPPIQSSNSSNPYNEPSLLDKRSSNNNKNTGRVPWNNPSHPTNGGSGARLARHLLRIQSAMPPPSTAAVAVHQHYRIVDTLTPVASATGTTGSSEIDIVWWLLLELLVASGKGAIPPERRSTTRPSENATDPPPQSHGQRQNIESISVPITDTENVAAAGNCDGHLLVLWTWFHQALLYSPMACHFLAQAAARTPKVNHAPISSSNGASNIQRPTTKPRIRIHLQSVSSSTNLNADANSSIVSQAEINLQDRLKAVRCSMTTPLWTSQLSAPSLAVTPTACQCQTVRRFIHEMCFNHMLNDTSLNRVILALQSAHLLLDATYVDWSSERTGWIRDFPSSLPSNAIPGLFIPDDFLVALLNVWIYSISHIFEQMAAQQPERMIPVRLLEVSNLTDSLYNAASNDSVSPSLDFVALVQKWFTGDIQDEQHFLFGSWMAEGLRWLIGIWNHSSCLVLRQQWTDSGRTARLVAAVVDFMEHCIFPNQDWHTHPLALECVDWLHTLSCMGRLEAEHQTCERCISLLRTRQPTSYTTATLWHCGPSAVAVAIQLFHRLVVRQHVDFNNSSSTESMALAPLRDRLVQFFHSLYLIVRESRRNWENMPGANIDEGEENSNPEKGVTPTGISEMLEEGTTLTTLLSECLDLYTSAAVVVRDLPEESNGCSKVHPDIRAMLKMQLDELAEDKDELSDLQELDRSDS